MGSAYGFFGQPKEEQDAGHEAARYEAMYAADMKAQAAVEICEQAGVELIHSGNGQWRWKRGEEHSYDEGDGFFETRDEAAIAFTRSMVFLRWLRSRGVTA